MERNHNPFVVVMAKEMYEQLINMIKVNDHYDPRLIDKHVRKFNPHRQAVHQEQVLMNERRRSEMIREARVFKEHHQGKVVYADVNMQNSKKGDDRVLCPVQVIRVNKDRRYIDVLKTNDKFDIKNKRYIKVSVDTLQLESPECYVQGVGAYRDYIVKENGPYDHREADHMSEEEMTKTVKDSYSDTDVVAVDVIA